MKVERLEWTDEQVAELKRLVEAGLTSKAIADAMGVTKGVIMGKVFREGLKLKGPKGKYERKEKPPTLEEIFPELQKPPPPPPPPPPEPPSFGRIPLMELGDGACHFIEGDASGGYCGRRATSYARPYCEQHMSRMYQPRRH